MPRTSSNSVKVFYPKHNREKVIEALQGTLPRLQRKLPLKLVALFGSYAKGNFTVASDVDLLIVYDGIARDDAYTLCKKTLGIPHLEPHVYSEREYEEMKPTIARMIKGGIVLFHKQEYDNA